MSEPTDQLVFALQYDDTSDAAPLVAAKGNQEVAKLILAAARKYGIPIVHRPELRPTAMQLAVDEEIPVALYDVVAKILHELDREV